ncbi:arylsulfatase [Prosthecobacter sp.]|uniref:arylsulfatase n=1 Tax=Prosthecobacter sp. TaxID=1965333 RepID=UPI0037834102
MKAFLHLFGLCLLAASLHAAPSLPNIVIILADDYGYGSAGCYGADARLVRTPNIDRLAAEGRRFTDASTPSSVCSPTRYALLTGRYCWRTSLKFETLSTFAPLHIEPGRLTMASMLKTRGYQTAAIGKWHLGYGPPGKDPKWRTDYTAELNPGPLELGFDHHFSVPQNHGDVTGVFVEDHFVYGLRSGKIPAGLKLPGPAPDDDHFATGYESEAQQKRGKMPLDLDAPHRKDEHVMTVLTEKTVAWIGKQKAGRPFFLYYTPVAVHEPVTPPKDLQGSSAAGKFGDWIHELDRSVGEVLGALKKNGFAENTLVIFTSDNGGIFEPANAARPESQAVAAGLKVNGTWRSGKTHIYEGGFRVPFIARWPGRIPAGTVCDEMVNVVDLLATIAAVVGEKLPPGDTVAEDSQNILPALLGTPNAPPSRGDMILHSNDGVFAIRKGPWKWIEGVPAERLPPNMRKSHAKEFQRALYNLHDDPGETQDVSAAHPEILQELEALLKARRGAGAAP